MVDLLDDVLPDECARIIWAQLRPQDLRAVMRVSPTWAKSAAPFLYRNVDLRDATALAALLRTVQRRPDVAALVRHLRMHQHVFSGPNRPQSLAGPAVDLLQSLPALQGLRLEGRWSGLDALISNGRLRVPLTDLRKVSLGIGRQPMAHLLPFWNLPKIESIRACMASPYDAIQEQQQEEEEEDQEEEAEPPITWPTAPTLLELDLDYTSLEEKSVTPLLRNSPALKSFRYDRWCNVGGVLSLQDCEELGRGLRHLRPTLEHLDLRVQLFSEYAEEVDELDIDPVQGHLPSLHDFNQLRALRIPIATLLGWTPNEVPRIETLLPPSLQRLSLAEDLRTQCTYQWTEELLLVELERFFASLSRSQHKLEVVEIYPDRTWGGWQNETMNRVYGMAATAAVQCIIVD